MSTEDNLNYKLTAKEIACIEKTMAWMNWLDDDNISKLEELRHQWVWKHYEVISIDEFMSLVLKNFEQSLANDNTDYFNTPLFKREPE